jgi:formate dehydrogenase iron-sulfur subunit
VAPAPEAARGLGCTGSSSSPTLVERAEFSVGQGPERLDRLCGRSLCKRVAHQLRPPRPETGKYDIETWQYEGANLHAAAGAREEGFAPPKRHAAGHGGAGARLHHGEPPREDETLEHPRCVFQVLRRHYLRYRPELVAETCGCPVEDFIAVAEALCDNSGPERTSAFVYSVGWTQHTVGVQYIRTASAIQLLLGNIGRPGGGILALRGHASIQGSTDIPTLYDILPGYLTMPHTIKCDGLQGFIEVNRSGGGWWGRFDAFIVSLLKAWWGAAATPENDFCFGYLPRIDQDNSTYWTTKRMLDGKVKGFIIAGERTRRSARPTHARTGWRRPSSTGSSSETSSRSSRRPSGTTRPRSSRASCAPRRSRPRSSSCRQPRTSRRTARSRHPAAGANGISRRSSPRKTAAPSSGSTHRHVGLHRLQGLRGRLQGVEPVPEDGMVWTGESYDNTSALGANSWRHVAFVEQRVPARGGNALGTPSDFASLVQTGEDGLRWLMSSDVCKHCTHAACLDVCPTGSLFRTEFGTVVVQEDICNGCGYCVPACPFGVLDRRHLADPERMGREDGRVWKCTLCYDRLKSGHEPACAKACPTDSIQFGPLDELRERADARLTKLQNEGWNGAQLYGRDPEDGVGGFGAFFLLLDEPEVYGLPPDPVVSTSRLGEMWGVGAPAAAAAALTLGVVAAFAGGRG